MLLNPANLSYWIFLAVGVVLFLLAQIKQLLSSDSTAPNTTIDEPKPISPTPTQPSDQAPETAI